MADRTDRKFIADVVEIPTAARLIRGGVFGHGVRIGTSPGGWPVWSSHGHVLVDMRPGSRFS